MAKPNKYRVELERSIEAQTAIVDSLRKQLVSSRSMFQKAASTLYALQRVKDAADGKDNATEDALAELATLGQEIDAAPSVAITANVPTQVVSLDTKPKRGRRKKLRDGDGAEAGNAQPPNPVWQEEWHEHTKELGTFPQLPNYPRRVPRRAEPETE